MDRAARRRDLSVSDPRSILSVRDLSVRDLWVSIPIKWLWVRSICICDWCNSVNWFPGFPSESSPVLVTGYYLYYRCRNLWLRGRRSAPRWAKAWMNAPLLLLHVKRKGWNYRLCTRPTSFIWSVRSTGTRLSRKGQILQSKYILKSILFHEFLIHIKQRLDSTPDKSPSTQPYLFS